MSSQGDGPPSFHVRSDEIGAEAAFEAMQGAIQDVFRIQSAGGGKDPFRVVMSAWHMGTIMVGAFDSSALSFERAPALVAAGGLDHLLVQYYSHGSFTGTADGHPIAVNPGDIVCFDLSRPLETVATDFRNITLLIPRAYFEGEIDDVSAFHGAVLPGTSQLGSMLAAYMVTLTEHLPTLDAEEAETSARATAAMATTVMASAARVYGGPERPPVLSPFRRVVHLIEGRLRDPALDVPSLAADLGMSRATLYRVFESVGGVAEYIRRRRLAGAAVALAAPENRRRRIADIAFSWGFASEATFNRTFKAAFGIGPGAARDRNFALWDAVTDGNDASNEQEFARWIRLLRV